MTAHYDSATAAKRPQLLKVSDVAQLLNVKPRTIYEMVAQDRIPYRKPPGSNILRFDLEEILEWIHRKTNDLRDRCCYYAARSLGGCNPQGEHHVCLQTRKSTHWHYYFRVRGVRYRGALPEAITKWEAEQAETKIKYEVFEGRLAS